MSKFCREGVGARGPGVAEGTRSDRNPVQPWSPQRRKIYFAEGPELPGHAKNLHVMNADGVVEHPFFGPTESSLEGITDPG